MDNGMLLTVPNSHNRLGRNGMKAYNQESKLKPSY